MNSRKFGRNQFPARILFETPGDFLRFAGKQLEFSVFSVAVTRLRDAFPSLENWIRSNVRTLIEAAPDLDGLLCVLQFFRDNPRPSRFARELPLSVDTKFIKRYQGLLRQWFDIVLPPYTIRADEEHFSDAMAYVTRSPTFSCECWTPRWPKNSSAHAQSFPSRCTRWGRCPWVLTLWSLLRTRSTC